MRIILLAFFTIFGANLVINVIDRADKIQQDKMHQLCQIDQSYCTTNVRNHAHSVNTNHEPLHRSQV